MSHDIPPSRRLLQNGDTLGVNATRIARHAPPDHPDAAAGIDDVMQRPGA